MFDAIPFPKKRFTTESDSEHSPEAPSAQPASSACDASVPHLFPEQLAETDMDEVPALPGNAESTAAGPLLPELPSIPAFLRSSERATTLLAGITGLVLGIITSLAAYYATPAGNVVERIFDPSDAATLIPVTVLSLFFFGCAIVFLRSWRMRATARVANGPLSVTVAEAITGQGPAAVVAWLDAPVTVASPLLRRVQTVSRQWLVSPGLADADLALQHHVAADAENLHAAYSMPRTIVWALPVLGLIGTVIGIALAVGGFAEFLGGDIDDIAAVKRNLVGVTGGLSFAFLITLLGLVTALVLMFFSSAMQAREEAFLADLQSWVSERILPALQRAQPASLPTTPAFGGEGFFPAFRQEMRNGARFMGQILSRSGEEVTQLLANDRRARETAVERGAALLRRELAAAAAEVAQSGERAAQHMADATVRLVAESEAVLRTVVGQTDELRALLATLAAEIANQTATLADVGYTLPEALNVQAEALREAGASATALASSVRDSLQAERESIAAVQEMQIGLALNKVAEQVAAQSRETHSAATAVKDLSEATLALAACHTSVQEGIHSLRELRLNDALSELGQGLEKIGPVLERFQQPFVLTAVPLQMPAQHAG
jgi:biopolymer transport protein ExbB/TolQ